MTKKEILGREYKLLKKTSYCLQESLDEVTFYPEMIFEVQDDELNEPDIVTLVTHFAGIEYKVPYSVTALQNFTWLWKEVE